MLGRSPHGGAARIFPSVGKLLFCRAVSGSPPGDGAAKWLREHHGLRPTVRAVIGSTDLSPKVAYFIGATQALPRSAESQDPNPSGT